MVKKQLIEVSLNRRLCKFIRGNSIVMEEISPEAIPILNYFNSLPSND